MINGFFKVAAITLLPVPLCIIAAIGLALVAAEPGAVGLVAVIGGAALGLGFALIILGALLQIIVGIE